VPQAARGLGLSLGEGRAVDVHAAIRQAAAVYIHETLTIYQRPTFTAAAAAPDDVIAWGLRAWAATIDAAGTRIRAALCCGNQ